MKLIYKILSRTSVALLILLAVWASVFYFIIIDEINDETDDALEHYSEYIITRALAGESLPSADNGTNNSYHIVEVTPEYASQNQTIQYRDEMVYLQAKRETEPARILKTIFRDAENRYFELTVAIPTIEKEDLQETILWWIVFLYFLLLLGIIGINAWVLGRSFRPLHILLGWLEQFTVGKELKPLENNTNVTEFQKLNEAIIRSAQRNIDTYEQQKQFIGHASHELQTPLSVCKNRLELLADDTALKEEQLEEVAKVQQTVDYIIKLNKTLLLLTKIENRQFPEQKNISLNDLIKKLLEDYAEVFAYRNITVSLEETTVLHAYMNETLASILFSNLLKNAYVHNHDNGLITVCITPSHISIQNTGIDYPLDPNLIFKRFYQGSKKEGSTGMGLALTDSICKLYDYPLSYHFRDERHCFTFHLTEKSK